MNIIIVGATSGIGRELWRHYVTNGHYVAALGRRKALLDNMQSEYPDNTLIYKADITDDVASSELIKGIFSTMQTVDLAIVCAGTGDINELLEYEIEKRSIMTNVVGWTAAVDAIYNQFNLQGKGHLVTITSVGGLNPTPSAPAYSATKAYQINYTKALQKKSRKSGVLVTEIRPGLVKTAMAKGSGLFWVMPVEKVARQIVRAIAHKKSTVVVTKRWRIISAILKHL